ncbi:MAG TPA: transporter substrate-binding domain-containing protein [Paludibacter sp.]|nr:transporter substrate-binding domain-containing protein [Paludibacter sp.]
MKKKLQIGILVAVLILLICIYSLFRHAHQQKHDLKGIIELGRITVVTESSSSGFLVNGDKVSGFQYEIIKAFADTLGVELVVTEQNDMKKCVEGLKNGDYDLIANFIPTTTQWKKELLYSDPIFTSHQVLVQHMISDSSRINVLAKQTLLANDTVYIAANSPNKILLEHLSNDIAAPIHIIEMKNMNAERLIRLVVEGKIKNTICEVQLAEKFKNQYGNIDIEMPIGFAQQQVWAVPTKSTKLLEKLNTFLYDFVGSSDYWKIYSKYY